MLIVSARTFKTWQSPLAFSSWPTQEPSLSSGLLGQVWIQWWTQSHQNWNSGSLSSYKGSQVSTLLTQSRLHPLLLLGGRKSFQLVGSADVRTEALSCKHGSQSGASRDNLLSYLVRPCELWRWHLCFRAPIACLVSLKFGPYYWGHRLWDLRESTLLCWVATVWLALSESTWSRAHQLPSLGTSND